jgi:hypothetical protein
MRLPRHVKEIPQVSQRVDLMQQENHFSLIYRPSTHLEELLENRHPLRVFPDRTSLQLHLRHLCHGLALLRIVLRVETNRRVWRCGDVDVRRATCAALGTVKSVHPVSVGPCHERRK